MPEMKSPEKQTTALAVAFKQDERFNPTALAALMGSKLDADSWIQAALSTMKNPTIAKSIPDTLFAALYKAASLRLPVDGVHFALMPFWNKSKNGYEIAGAVGYPGWVSLYVRHANATHVQTGVIFEGEDYEYEEGLQQRFRHVPDPKGDHTRGDQVLATYAIVHLKGGNKHLCIVWRDVLEEIRTKALARAGGKASTYDGGTTLIEMWRKAAIIRARKGLAITDSGVAAALADEERREIEDPRDTEYEVVASGTPPPRNVDDLVKSKKNDRQEEHEEPQETGGEVQDAEFERTGSDGPVVRDICGFPNDLGDEWDTVRTKMLEGDDTLLAKLTPDEITKKLIDGDAKIKTRVKQRLDQAVKMYGEGKTPPKRFMILALAWEQFELGERF
jgi:phage RecT family recombinase